MRVFAQLAQKFSFEFDGLHQRPMLIGLTGPRQGVQPPCGRRS